MLALLVASCLLLPVTSGQLALPEHFFLPAGPDHGDQTLNQDDGSSTINNPTGFLFYGSNYNDLYVSFSIIVLFGKLVLDNEIRPTVNPKNITFLTCSSLLFGYYNTYL